MNRYSEYDDILMSTFLVTTPRKKVADRPIVLSHDQLKQWFEQQPILGKIVPFTGRFSETTPVDVFLKHNLVLLYPGNDGHTKDQLYTQTPGANLAKVAYHFSRQGVPTLSLPTTFFNVQNHRSDATRKIATREIAKLWRALGAGYNFVLPVRPVKPQNPIFSKAHKQSLREVAVLPSDCNGKPMDYEPSMWGGVSPTTQRHTKHLPAIYSVNLRLLQIFALNWNDSPSFEDKINLIEKLKTLADYDGKYLARSFIKGLLFKHDPSRLSYNEKRWFSQSTHNREEIRCCKK